MDLEIFELASLQRCAGLIKKQIGLSACFPVEYLLGKNSRGMGVNFIVLLFKAR